MFEPLIRSQIRDIVGLRAAALVARVAAQHITLKLGDSSLEYLAAKVRVDLPSVLSPSSPNATVRCLLGGWGSTHEYRAATVGAGLHGWGGGGGGGVGGVAAQHITLNLGDSSLEYLAAKVRIGFS